MVKRYIVVVGVLASLLAACGARTDGKTSQPGNMIDLVALPSGWTIDTLDELDQADIPANAYTGLQQSFRAMASEPNQPENETGTAYFFILLYEDATAARNAYMQIKTHMIVEGAEIGDTKGNLPNEEISFALTNRSATATRPASSLIQSTTLSCRAVVRFNWALYYASDSSFAMNDAINVEMASVREIRQATCDEK